MPRPGDHRANRWRAIIARNLAAARASRRLTQWQFSLKIHVQVGTLAKWEQEEHAIDSGILGVAAETLKIPVSDFFQDPPPDYMVPFVREPKDRGTELESEKPQAS